MADRGFSSQKCYDYDTIIKMDGEVVSNSDGSVSVYMLNNVGVLAPVILTKTCCEALGPYTFDIDTQKCMTSSKPSSCSINDVFKVVLNPKGNSGALFYTDEDETCQLNVSFDYLFKVNCDTLSSMITGKQVSGMIPQIMGVIEAIPTKDTLSLAAQIKEQEALCTSFSYQLEQINKELSSTPYSIECLFEQTPVPVKVTKESVAQSFNKTAFGSNSAIAPFGLYFASSTGTFCLTSDGLSVWEKMLGPIRYQAFLNADPNSYSCTDVQSIVEQNVNNLLKGDVELVYECSVPFGTRTKLLSQQSEILKNLEQCRLILNELTVKAEILTPIITPIIEQQVSSCSSPIDFFETFSVSMTIEMVTSANTLETVYEQPLFGPIGAGNLYNYLTSAGTSSGFYVCGEPNETETNFNGCTPLLFEFEGTDVDNVTACQTVMSNILDGLYQESGLSGTTDGPSIFQDSLSVSALTSNWVNFNTLITDPAVLDLIKNQLIKISFKINSTCGNFCILVDEISLNKVCSKVKESNLFITQPPGFQLERIRDNKKSWLANTTPVNRVFDIKNTLDTNAIRQTNYDVNDERLVINTKEIDLDINIASGIENDVWCYIVDNPCILSGVCVYTTATTTAMTFNLTNLIVNGTFDVSMSGWTVAPFDNWVSSANTAVYVGADEGGYMQQTALTVGNTYKVTFDLTYETPDNLILSDIDVSLGSNLTPINYSGGTYNIEITGVCSTNGIFKIAAYDNAGDGLVYVIDNVVVLEGEVTTSTTVTSSCCDQCVVYSASCGNKSFQDSECFLFQDSEVYEFMDGDYTLYPNLTLNGSNCCGDEIDFTTLMTQPLSAVTTIEDFNYFLTSELIDAKNRQTISSYPTLKALYERYLNSAEYCGNNSSAFNYVTMDQFAGLIDSYWVDIVEQVIPATTIWGSVKIYSNTMFDQQKYKYKAYSSLFCGNPYSGKTMLSPINGTTGQCADVEVITSNIVLSSQENVRMRPIKSVCNNLCIAQMNMGSEFIGRVTIDSFTD